MARTLDVEYDPHSPLARKVFPEDTARRGLGVERGGSQVIISDISGTPRAYSASEMGGNPELGRARNVDVVSEVKFMPDMTADQRRAAYAPENTRLARIRGIADSIEAERTRNAELAAANFASPIHGLAMERKKEFETALAPQTWGIGTSIRENPSARQEKSGGPYNPQVERDTVVAMAMRALGRKVADEFAKPSHGYVGEDALYEGVPSLKMGSIGRPKWKNPYEGTAMLGLP